MTINNAVLVIAGNHQQYQAFLRQHKVSPLQFRYCSQPEHIMGMRDATYVKTGEWWLNPILDKRPELLKVFNMKEVKMEKIE